VIGQHLGVAGRTKHATEPPEVGGQPRGGVMAQNAPERTERGAQTPAGDPHLVHGGGLVQAHQRVQRHQRAGVRAQVGQHHLARGRRPGERGPAIGVSGGP
jgi:hypothetical protein